MKPYTRAERVSIKIQQTITELLSKKMQDPRMEMATISGVRMSPDLTLAYVYVTVFGGKKRVREALEGFQRSKGFIKKNIAPKLDLRIMPDLRFIHDDSFDEAARLDALIDAAPKGEDRDEDAEGTDGALGDPVE
nr:30S ribosome-binding factor RbfA [uncultured Desulfobacter sp.]